VVDQRLDGYKNLLSGYGTNRDPSEHTIPQSDAAITQAHAESISHLNAKQKFNRALRWAGLYGGAVMVMLIDDRQPDLSLPVREGQVRSVEDLLVYDRHQINWSPDTISTNPSVSWYGKPERFLISPIQGMPFTVHRSRLLFFDGQDIPDQLRSQNDGWGDSRLQAVYRSLSRYAEGISSTSSILRDFILPVLSMKDLSAMISSGKEQIIKDRLELLGLSRSILNVMLIDAQEEGYEKKASSVTGIDNLLEELKHNIAACAGIPQTKLFGRSPSGQNATGESDIRQWYDSVRGEQEDRLVPPLFELVRILDLASGLQQPEGRAIVPEPLWQPSKQEQVTTHKMAAETASLLLDYGVIDPVAAERYIASIGVNTHAGDVSFGGNRINDTII